MENKNIDYKLLWAVYFLTIFWMIMISSVSVFSSYNYTWWEANNYFLIRNISHIAISSILLFVIAKINYNFFKRIAPFIFIVWVISLFSVLIFWKELNWAKWWLDIPILPFAIQPAEFIKVWVILFLSYLFSVYSKWSSDLKTWFVPYILTMWVVLGLLAMQPDFWSILVLAPISAIIFFIAWGNIKYLMWIALSWLLLLVWVYNAWKYDPSIWEEKPALGYIYDRFSSFLWKEEDEEKSWDVLYQQDQALIAIWSWGFTWVWFWNSVQKYWYIPEVQWDFIFSVIVEELGFIWMIILLYTYFYIAYRWLQIYRYSKDDFARYFAIWVSSRILLQAFVNISVNLKILPNTWITLPFISYWGSSLMSLMIAIWILISISKNTENTPVYFKRFSKISWYSSKEFMIK